MGTGFKPGQELRILIITQDGVETDIWSRMKPAPKADTTGGLSIFFERPIEAALLGVAFLAFFAPLLQAMLIRWMNRRRSSNSQNNERGG